jgi:hypothetical protein
LNLHEIAPASTSSQNTVYRRVSSRLKSLIFGFRGVALFRRFSRCGYSLGYIHPPLQKIFGHAQIFSIDDVITPLHAKGFVPRNLHPNDLEFSVPVEPPWRLRPLLVSFTFRSGHRLSQIDAAAFWTTSISNRRNWSGIEATKGSLSSRKERR